MANTKIQTPKAYPSAARLAIPIAILNTLASLKCLEQSNSYKSKCQEHFDNYKECKKKERRLGGAQSKSVFILMSHNKLKSIVLSLYNICQANNTSFNLFQEAIVTQSLHVRINVIVFVVAFFGSFGNRFVDSIFT
ncbi:hypothetical protein RND71_007745 [Anisodus tanguticus]|uniref:Uncharacterized protein n=1 Tax=Anisodus tanguticus TaxID=243964 RepID=A0AAE1SMH1_9SOLA|nr:hypothetical protein RND71_007745 [Anisodus tanguticus]